MNNNNYMITILQNFEKPEQDFIKDKECLICLDPFDLESNQHVMLPCKCANSVYHIGCIVLMLNSGQNKNFCPHCKAKYEIPEPQNQQLVNLTHIQQRALQLQNLHTQKFTNILIIHILSNSIMNIINIVSARSSDETHSDDAIQLLMLFYFGKLFFNYVILMYSKSHNNNNIEECLIGSYVYQLILFVLLIYTLTKIKKNDILAILIMNNMLLGFGDLAYRLIIEYRTQNMVVAE